MDPRPMVSAFCLLWTSWLYLQVLMVRGSLTFMEPGRVRFLTYFDTSKGSVLHQHMVFLSLAPPPRVDEDVGMSMWGLVTYH